jgi:hypothetical protein
VEKLTWKSLVLAALKNSKVQEAKGFAETGSEEHIDEMARIEAQIALVNQYSDAARLLHALDRLRSRVAYECQAAGGNGVGPPAWSREAVGLSANGKGHAASPRALEYPDAGRPRYRRSR